MKEQEQSSKPPSEADGSIESEESRSDEVAQGSDPQSASTESSPEEKEVLRRQYLFEMIESRPKRVICETALDIREGIIHLCSDSEVVQGLLGRIADSLDVLTMGAVGPLSEAEMEEFDAAQKKAASKEPRSKEDQAGGQDGG